MELFFGFTAQAVMNVTKLDALHRIPHTTQAPIWRKPWLRLESSRRTIASRAPSSSRRTRRSGEDWSAAAAEEAAGAAEEAGAGEESDEDAEDDASLGSDDDAEDASDSDGGELLSDDEMTMTTKMKRMGRR